MSKFDLIIHNLPLDITNTIIKDFKTDLEIIDYFPKHKLNFINNIEFHILYISFNKNEFYDMLLYMNYYNSCNYFHGYESSRQICIRDICEYIDLYDNHLKLLYFHNKCPIELKKDIEKFYYYSDYDL